MEGMEAHALVVLVRPPDSPDFSEEELDRIQAAHLAHLSSLRDEGVLVATGPFDDQTDERFRGLCIYTVPVEEARRRAEADPAVVARRLGVVAVTWWAQEGDVRFGA